MGGKGSGPKPGRPAMEGAGRPRSLPSLTRKLVALRVAFEATHQAQHAKRWTDAELSALVNAIEALATPFKIEQFDRWQEAAEDKE